MANWITALSKTRKNLLGGLGKLFVAGGKELDADSLELLEESLIQADVAPKLAMEWVQEIERARSDDKRALLRELLLDELGPDTVFEWKQGVKPCTILVVGINGSGKTTTCAKLAAQAAKHGARAQLAATDTFRAAGADQLRLWADRIGCDVVAGKMGADAAAVAYDALEAAIARKADVLIVDTAGRMHTKGPLMEELKKVKRAMTKKMDGAPHETWIILDASLGQNAIIQARIFHETAPLTGVIVTKLDGSSKGGFLFSVRRELQVPIIMVGIGEQQDDLVAFRAADYVDALLSND
jgi:fused signal recognition particle receptor